MWLEKRIVPTYLIAVRLFALICINSVVYSSCTIAWPQQQPYYYLKALQLTYYYLKRSWEEPKMLSPLSKSPTLPEPYSRMFPISEDGSSSVSAGFETRLTVSKFVSAPSSVSRICKHDGSIKAGYTPLASPRIHSPSIPSSILTCSF